VNSVESLAAHCDDMEASEILTLPANCSHRTFQFYEYLMTSPGVKLNELQVSKGLYNLFVAVWKC